MSNRPSLLAVVLLVALVACDRSPTQPNDTVPSDPTPDHVGGLFSLNTQSGKDMACEPPEYQTARVEAISQRAIVVADTLNPAGGFTREDYQHFAERFDNLIAPLAEANFGEWTDIDGTGRVVLFFTKEVNRLTAHDAEAFVAGFFFARDLFGRESIQREGAPTLGACAHSNERELLYLLVPDPEGEVGRDLTREEVQTFMLATIIHELQHLINAARRLHIVPRGGEWAEETWLNEALSHTAEELLFYGESGLGPKDNIHPDTLTTPHDASYSRHQRFNFRRLHRFLEEPEENSPYNEVDGLETRGASWSFLRYLTDRLTADPAVFYRGLVDREARGLANLAAGVGNGTVLTESLARWSTVIYADGRVPGLDETHSDLSWNHRSAWLKVSATDPYPIRTRTLIHDQPVGVQVLAGGSAYFRFGIAAGQTGAVELLVGDHPPQEGSLGAACDLDVSPGEVGEAEEIAGAAGLVICVQAPPELTTTAEYVLVGTAAVSESESPLALSARSENTVGTVGPPSPLIAGAESAGATEEFDGLFRRDHEFEARLREQERVELGPLVGGVAATRGAYAALQPATEGEAFRYTLLRTN